MEGNKMNTEVSQPLEWLAANDAVARCEKLESDFRNKGDSCHNNIGSKTYDDWERMDKFLVAAADEIRSIHDCVKSLVALYSRQKLRNCDIGTAEEQEKRFVEYCKNHRIKITGHADACNPKCPCRIGGDLNLCTLAWGQMPYESEAK